MNPFVGAGVTSVPSKYVFPLGGGAREKRFIVAAHINWVRELISETTIPASFQVHDKLGEEEVQAYLSQGKVGALGPQWMMLQLTVIKCTRTVSSFRQLETGGGGKRGCRMTWPEVVDFIGQSNFDYVWEQPELCLLEESVIHHNSATRNNKTQQQPFSGIQVEESMYLMKLMKNIYINLEGDNSSSAEKSSSRGEEESTKESERFPVSNLCQAVSIIQTSSGSSSQEDVFFVFHPFNPYSLHDAVTFSPQKLANTGKQMFVSYQILQFLRDFQTLELPLGNLTLKDFFIDEALYLNVIPPIVETLEELREQSGGKDGGRRVGGQIGDPKVIEVVKCIVNKVRGRGGEDHEMGNICQKNLVTPSIVEAVIRHWVEGLISNYDYLMFLNYLCGRFCNGNPNFHPVFPWVTDFSQSQGAWRDMTKSKFRLNKGERQLDIMYEEIGSNEKTVAHHVTDILSEITYYVYKARRTSKEVLCKFVRPKWVPAEYPASITRLQEWTPDECIPEFFDDPLIFKSIHEDLPDLQVPKWCSSSDEFIKYHRRVLESDVVSAKLHHWIDLTFGYKLSGQAAVKSKNIYLSLVDSHQYLESHGVVQLFQTAHPPRKSPLRNFKNTVSYKDLKKLREQENEESSQDGVNNSSSDPKTKVWKNINLPKHYDPMGFLNDFEVTLNFFKVHFPYLKNPSVKLTGLKNRDENNHFVKIFGCLLLELVLPHKVRHIATSVKSVHEKFTFYKDIVKGSMHFIPLYCRRAIQAIFDRDSLEFSIPLDISLDIILLGDRLGPIPFPVYFEDIYKMIRTLRNQEKILATVAPENLALKTHLQEFKVKTFSRELIQLLSSLDADGIDLVLPYVIELFENPETRVLAVWNLFCPFARAIGKKKAAEHLLYPIIQIYETDYHSDKHLKLFHRTFLLQLSSCFGLKIFLDYFSTLLIEAIGGWKASGDQTDPTHRTHLNSTELEIEQIEEPSSTSSPKKKGGNTVALKKIQSLKRIESESGESVGQPVEPEMFVMEPDVSDSEGNESNTESTSTTAQDSSNSNPTTQFFPSIFVNDQKQSGSNGSSRNQSPLQISQSRFHTKDGMNTRSSSISSIGTIGSKSVVDISELCCESVVWLSHRLGPVLTAKYLTKNLLRMLTLCYLDHLELLERNATPLKGGGVLCEGDIHSKKVLECLLLVSDLYGDSFIDRQYIPYCIEIISSAVQKMTLTVEAALIGVATLLEKVFQFMADTLLMAQLKDPIMKYILSPLIEIVCSDQKQFPSDTLPRILLLNKCMGMMNYIRKKIGPDLTQLHLKPLIVQICSAFDGVYNGRMKADLCNVFDSSVAYLIFTNFCDVITGTEHETLIRDLYLKQGLTAQSLAAKDDASPMSEKAQEKRRVEQQSSFGSRSFGNRIQVQEVELPTEEPETTVPSRKDPTRHLRGNWLVYWEHEVGRSDSKFNFKQIKLHTFVGHSSSVRCIYSLDNENSFLSASKDKTVKLFSLRNQGDETGVSNCQWTYSQHKKAVLSVIFLESLHMAVSTDGFIHIWDPFVGKTLRILDKGPAAKTSQVCALRPILNSSLFVGAGIDSTIHVVDSRSCNAYELKIGIGQASGLVRCMAVSDSGQVVAVGHSSGMLSALDLRNGTLLGSWKAHEGEVLQLMPYKNKHLISSSFDQNISVWNMDDNRPVFNMRGPTEPVHSLCTYENELITCTTSNRIGIHCGIDANADFSSTRLRSDTFKGIVTSMRLLPLNQFLLLGSDSGHIGLLC